MAMKNPVHPGAIVREDCLRPLALSVSEGARRLGVGRQTHCCRIGFVQRTVAINDVP